MTTLLSGCHEQKQTSVKEIRIGILQIPDDIAVARQEGYFKDYFQKRHIKIKYVPFDSGVDANKALMAGDVDFASMGDTNALVALNAGIKVKLAWINSLIGSNEGLVVRKGSHINHLADLKGKKIATPFASTSHYSLMMTLNRHHLLKRVHLYDMDTQSIVSAWQRHNIDAAYTWEPTLSELLKNGHLLTTSSKLGNEGYPTANVLLVRNNFAKSHPALTAGVLQQLDKAHRLFNSKKRHAIKAAAAQTDVSFRAAKQQIGNSIWPSSKQLFSNQYLGKHGNGNFTVALNHTAIFMYHQQTIDHLPKYQQIKSFIETTNLQGR